MPKFSSYPGVSSANDDDLLLLDVEPITSDSTSTITKANLFNGDQTITGVKTFSSGPIVPDPTTSLQVANKEYVDAQVAGDVPVATFTTNGTVKQTVYNVRDYGAVGDGVADDSEALQACLTAAAGGEMFIPLGTYVVPSSKMPLIIPSNIAITGNGYGSYIKGTGTDIVGMFTNTNTSTVGDTNIYISNVGLEINQSTGFPTNNNQEVLEFSGVSHAVIDNVYFINGGVHFNALSTYRDTSTCLTQGNSAYNKVVNCHFDSTCLISVVFSQSSHSLATNNTCHGYDSPISILGAWEDITIANNQIYTQSQSGQGIEVNQDIGLQAWTDISIIDNYINNAVQVGILISGGSSGQFVERVNVSGNIVTNALQYGISTNQNVRSVQITDNTIYNSGRTGIAIVSDVATVSDILIADNSLYNNGQSGARPYGIELHATASAAIISDVDIHDNIVFDTQGSPTTTVGIRLTTENSNNTISANIHDNDLAQIALPYQVGGPGTTTVSGSNNSGVNPSVQYAQGNITGSTTFTRVNGSVIIATLTGNVTAAVTGGIIRGSVLNMVLTQDATGGRTVTWPSNVKNGPVLRTTASAIDVITLVWDGTNWNSGGIISPLPIANGGTGSTTQNFVDLSTTQSSIGGSKTFTSGVTALGNDNLFGAGATGSGGGYVDIGSQGTNNGYLEVRSSATDANLNLLAKGAGTIIANGSITLSTKNIVTDTTTGTKIATATTQKLGFYNATPVVQQTGDVATALSTLGLVGTPTIVATTNANLTGVITSSGNATSIALQTGTGTKFVVDTSPTLVTPVIGVATGTGLTLTGSGANSLAVGLNGATNPAFNVDASTASSATGLNVKSAAAAAGIALSVLSSGTNENLTITAKGTGTITLNTSGNGNVLIGPRLQTAAITSTVTSANAFVIGQNGATNPTLSINTNTASSATGINITSAAAAGGVAISAISSGGNENLTIDSKGTGTITINGTATGGITFGQNVTHPLGKTINIGTGSNAIAGTGTLVAGTATISTSAVTASSLVFLTDTASSITNVGSLTVSAKTAGTSFVVTSTLALDTSTFNWFIIN